METVTDKIIMRAAAAMDKIRFAFWKKKLWTKLTVELKSIETFVDTGLFSQLLWLY